MIIRRMKEEDLPQVEAIEASLFSDAWSRQGFLDALDSECTISLVAEDNSFDSDGKTGGNILGYIIMYVFFEEGEICNVAVKEDAQNHGVGSALMHEIIEIGTQEAVTRFILEVRVSNTPAIALYRNYEFTEIGVRRGFYEKPREDALIMIREKETEKC